jgi:hypothetical protein
MPHAHDYHGRRKEAGARATASAPAVLGFTVADAHRGVPGGHSVAVASGSVVAATLLLDSLAWSRQSYTQLGAPCHVTFPPRPCAAHARAGVLPDDGPCRGGEHRDDVRHPRRASRTCWRARAGARTRRARFSRTAGVRLSYTKPRCRGMRAQWTPGACSASRQASPARRSAEPTAGCPGPQRHPCRTRTSAQSIQAMCMLWGFLWVTAWLQALEGWLPVFNNGAGRELRAQCAGAAGGY